MTVEGQMFGSYRIDRKLGQGGMGAVYLALDTRLDRQVALKFLTDQMRDNQRVKTRFIREAKAAATLNHPNIVTVHTIEEEDDQFCIVMEYVEGPTLAKLITDEGMSSEQFLSLITPLTDALSKAHEKGIIHRDIKPDNVLITAEGVPKLSDFGLARRESIPGKNAVGEDLETLSSAGQATQSEALTGSQAILGTPNYLSPEQARAKPVTPASDIFSLGIMMYEMLCGQRPFRGGSVGDIISSIIRDEPVRPSDVNPRCDGTLCGIVTRCLEKQPDRRYASGTELSKHLKEVAQQEPGQERSAQIISQMVTGEFPAKSPSIEARSDRESPIEVRFPHMRPRKLFLVLVLAAIVIGSSVLMLNYLNWEGDSPSLPISSNEVRSLVALPCTIHDPEDYAYMTDAIPSSLSTYLTSSKDFETKFPPSKIDMDKIKGNLDTVAKLYQVTTFVMSSLVPVPETEHFTLNVQLVAAANRTQLWSKSFRLDPKEYNEIMQTVAREIKRFVSPHTTETGISLPTPVRDSQAELLFREAEFFFNRFNYLHNHQDFEQALEKFKEVLVLDPKNGDAAALIGFLYILRMETDTMEIPDTREIIEVWAEKALAIDPRNGLALCLKGVVNDIGLERDPFVLFGYALKACRYDPDKKLAIQGLGLSLNDFSFTLACVCFEKALSLDYFYLWARCVLVFKLVYLGNMERALQILGKMELIEPESPITSYTKEFFLLEQGRFDEAHRLHTVLERSVKEKKLAALYLEGLTTQLTILEGTADQVDQFVSKINAVLDDPKISQREKWAMYHSSSFCLSKRGRYDDAVTLMEKFSDKGIIEPYDVMLFNPDLKKLHGHPGFQPLLEASRKSFQKMLDFLEDARKKDEFPAFLEKPLQELLERIGQAESEYHMKQKTS
ncbi:protein kinase [candidate division CSSED10-310 bacterium]|uniref:Protein kinase n=1 Tax=candidate division CSSED10-310 bacterium TaxID=2855610 RepID=A0ABV6YZC6_UNCC1